VVHEAATISVYVIALREEGVPNCGVVLVDDLSNLIKPACEQFSFMNSSGGSKEASWRGIVGSPVDSTSVPYRVVRNQPPACATRPAAESDPCRVQVTVRDFKVLARKINCDFSARSGAAESGWTETKGSSKGASYSHRPTKECIGPPGAGVGARNCVQGVQRPFFPKPGVLLPSLHPTEPVNGLARTRTRRTRTPEEHGGTEKIVL
jgi:hypothetical protein